MSVTFSFTLPESPLVTIVLPIRNEGRFIASTLGAVLSQDYPHNLLEIVVADGESTDDTRQVITKLANGSDIPVTIVNNPGRIVPTGFNLALRASRGDIIVRVDGHTIISPNYVRACVHALQRTGAANVGGRMDPVGTNSFGKAVAIATTSPFGVGGSRFHYYRGEAWVDTVYMGAWPRAVFDEIGMFDEEQVRNQDDEFNYRLVSRGGRILLSPEITSTYYNRGTPRTLWRQYLQYGYWKVRVMQKHPRQMSARQFVPAAFVLALLISGLAAIVWQPAALMLAGVLAAYIGSSLVAALLASSREPGMIPLVMLAFGSAHLSYGSGFLAGLVCFRNRWSEPQRIERLQSNAICDSAVGRTEIPQL